MSVGRLVAATVAATVIALVPGSSAADGPTASAAPQTAVGTVATMSPFPALLLQAWPDGTRTYCEAWQGTLKTSGGQSLGFYVETPMSGTVPSLKPTDQGAVTAAKILVTGWIQRKTLTATITYTPGSIIDCGYSLANVVTAVVLKAPTPVVRKTSGPLTSFSGRRTERAAGAVCADWHGLLSLPGDRFAAFDVVSTMTAGRVDDARALRLAATLRRATRQHGKAVVDVTDKGPVLACGIIYPHVVTAVTVRRRATR